MADLARYLREVAGPSVGRFALHVAAGVALGLGCYGVSVLVDAPLPSYVVGLIASAPGWRELSDFVNQTWVKTIVDVGSWVTAGLLAAWLAGVLREIKMNLGDGWKSKLGAALIIVGGFVKQLPYEWADPASELLTYIGGALLGLGVAHKIEKAGLPR